MKKIVILSSLFVVAVAFTYRTGDDIRNFDWLRGTWTMKVKKGTITEYWYTKDGKALQGESKMAFSNGQSKQMENLRLVNESGKFYYISRVAGQNNDQEIRFEITSYSKAGFVAENPIHDFPKRITYELINRDSIHAFIDGGVSAPDKRSDFYYSRVKD